MSKWIHAWAPVAAALLFALCAPLRATDPDDQIETSAGRSFIFQTFLKRAVVESRSGVVTLRGTVDEVPHKSLAVYAVESLPGVARIDNRLDVAGGSPEENSDHWLGAQVKMTLLLHRNVSACEPLVRVKNGIVSLHGHASSPAQLELIFEHVKNVPGVQGVRSEMTVGGSAPGPSSFEVIDGNIDDVSVTALVKWCLLSHRWTHALNTKVETSEGIVTLRGQAEIPDQSERAARLVADIPGVVGVSNLITVVRDASSVPPRPLPPKNPRIVAN